MKERLTELFCKVPKKYCFIGSIYNMSLMQNVANKLGELENIEEEYNIDILEAVNLCKKANKQKVVYVKESWGIDTINLLDDLDVEIFNHRLYSNARGVYISLDILEYNKTWALNKEDLKVY